MQYFQVGSGSWNKSSWDWLRTQKVPKMTGVAFVSLGRCIIVNKSYWWVRHYYNITTATFGRSGLVDNTCPSKDWTEPWPVTRLREVTSRRNSRTKEWQTQMKESKFSAPLLPSQKVLGIPSKTTSFPYWRQIPPGSENQSGIFLLQHSQPLWPMWVCGVGEREQESLMVGKEPPAPSYYHHLQEGPWNPRD